MTEYKGRTAQLIERERHIRTLPRHPFRPSCQLCGAHMIAITALVKTKRRFECLRCHRQETCGIEPPSAAQGDH
jgi:hypothetical protein